MVESKERPNIEKSYLVQEQLSGIRVIDQTTGDQFFRTGAGGWFWLMGPGNPFDEDVELSGREKDYLNDIAVAAGFDLKHPNIRT